MSAKEAYIVEPLRTPIGRYGGALREVRPDDLSALVMRETVRRAGIDPALIDDVLWGCANQAGEDNRNVARIAALLAGLPDSVPGATVNRLCGSGMDAVHAAFRGIRAGDYRAVLAGGVESMSRAPYSVPKSQGGAFGNVTAWDTALGWRYPNPALQALFPLEAMGETAENVAERHRVARGDQDAFALRSHQRAVAARGRLREEILPVPIPKKKGESVTVDVDEGPREDTSIEKLAALPPVFRKGGSVTAGNSSSLNDGAAAMLVVSGELLPSLSSPQLARIVSTGSAGLDPRIMGMGPVPASRLALSRAGLDVRSIDLVELNEAFAAQALPVIAELDLDPERVNVNGGAIALGHPLGCSGARLLVTLARELARRKARYGLATMCIGVGQGIATVIENVHAG